MKTGTYPLVLLVSVNAIPYRYKIIFDLSLEDYQKLSAPRISERLQNIRDKLKQIQREVDIYLEQNSPFELKPFLNDFVCGHPLFKPRKKEEVYMTNSDPEGFDFEPYKKRFPIFGEDHSKPGTISVTYLDYIKRLIREERIGSALNYQDSYNSIKRFRGNVCFTDITVSFLFQYEQWMHNRGCSKSTVGIKLRPLRAIFNEAIEQGIIRKEKCYPFGRRRYQIPTSRNVKKALDMESIGEIYYYQPLNDDERKAKDFWLFCYFGNGMNPKDVAYLKYKNIEGNYLVFVRAKTERTTRHNSRPITVFINEEMKRVIDDWGNTDKSPNNYIFPIISAEFSPLEQHYIIRNFVKFINDRMKRIAAGLGIDRKVTTIVSRHSFSTQLKRSGASTEFIQEALGHTDKKTTENYLDSFENDIKKQFAEKLRMFKRVEN